MARHQVVSTDEIRAAAAAWWRAQVIAARNDVNVFMALAFRNDQDDLAPPFEQQWFHREWQDLWLNARMSVIHGATGFGKCLAPETLVRLFDGSLKRADEVVIGDRLAGPDGRPRNVLSTTRGRSPMVRVVPNKGTPWICNDVHVLTLVDTVTGRVFDMPVDEFERQTKTFKRRAKLFFPRKGIEFEPREAPPVDPYFLGVWFGDGTKNLTHTVTVSKPDPEIEACCREVAAAWGLSVTVYRYDGKCPSYNIVGGGKFRNPLIVTMRDLVGPEVTIPTCISQGSIKTRLAFLAGLFDTDGHLFKGTIECTQKREDYAREAALICRSVGLQATVAPKRVGETTYWRLIASGDLARLPLRIRRRRPEPRTCEKDPSRTGFRLERLPEGDYAGFTLDGDGRFLLADSTVTHNTEQILGHLIWRAGRKPSIRIGIVCKTVDKARERMASIKRKIEHSPIIQEIFPELTPGEPWNTEKLRLSSAGTDTTTNTFTPYGIDSDIVGARCDIIVFDDVTDDENSSTEAQRQKAIDWADKAAQTRLTTNGQLHVLANAWHPKDMPHVYAKRPGIVYRVYPAEFDDGRLLWPDFRPRSWLDEKKRTMTPTSYAQMFLCKARDDGTRVFQKEWFAAARKRGAGREPIWSVPRFVDEATARRNVSPLAVATGAAFAQRNALRVVIGVDLATGKKERKRKSDLTVFFVLGVWSHTGERQVLWVEGGRWPVTESLQRLRNLEERYHPERFVVEDNGAQEFFVEFAQHFPDCSPRVEGFTTSGQKWDEALGVEGIGVEMNAGRWAIPSPSDGESEEAYLARLGPEPEPGEDPQLYWARFQMANREARKAYAEICQWAEHLEEFQRGVHTPDDVMGSYFAKEGVLRMTSGVFQELNWRNPSPVGAPATAAERERATLGNAGNFNPPPPPPPKPPPVPNPYGLLVPRVNYR